MAVPPEQPAVPFRSWIGHRLREAALHARRLRMPRGERRIVFFPCSGPWMGSSLLRAYEMARELQTLGWRAVVVPPHLELKQRRRILALESPDVLVIQKGRHPANWPELYRTDALRVFDLDDADYNDPAQEPQCVACCEGSDLVLAGSANVAAWCGRYSKDVRTIWTGHPIPTARAGPRPAARARVVAWAQSDPMRYQREAEFVRDVALELRQSTEFELWLFGLRDDREADAFIAPLRRASITVRLHRFMPNDRFVRTLEHAAVGMHVLLSDSPFAEGKSFGKVLAYLCADVAVVASDLHENAAFFEHGRTGLLCSTRAQWVEAVRDLLDNPQRREAIADAAHDAFRDRLSLPVIARQVDAVLRGALGQRQAALNGSPLP